MYDQKRQIRFKAVNLRRYWPSYGNCREFSCRYFTTVV